jgi:hypothetical protein
MDDNWARVFGAFIAAMGIWMIRLGRQSKATAEEAKHWPTTEAVITTSKVKKMPGANAKFRFKVAYRYEVGSQVYKNDRIAIGGEITSGRTRAEKRQAMYPEGSAHAVVYNPAKPSEVYLEPGVEGGGRLEWVGGLLGVLVGALLLFGVIG